MVRFLLVGFYSYGFWVGAVFVHQHYYNEIKDKDFDAGTVLTIVIIISIGLINILSLNPNIRAINEARVVGKTIFDIVDRVPQIADHPNCVDNLTLNRAITFQNVVFRYPTQPKQQANVL